VINAFVEQNAAKRCQWPTGTNALELGSNRFHRRRGGTAHDPEVERLYRGG